MELLCALGGVCVAGSQVAGAACLNLIRNRHVVSLFKGVHHVQHAVAGAGTQVKDLGALIGHHIVDGCHVTTSQIHHVDVVADAGAIGRGIVVAEHAQLLAAADGHLRDVGHEVVGDTLGIFADLAADVCAHGIEVAQQHHAPLRIGSGDVAEDDLAHVLRPAVGVGAVAGLGALGERHLVVAGVHRGGGGEDNALAAVLLHDAAQGEGRVEVVVVIHHGLCHRLAHGLEAGEVDDTVDVVCFKDGAELGLITEIQLVKDGGLAGDLRHALHGLGLGVDQVIHDHHVHITL